MTLNFSPHRQRAIMLRALWSDKRSQLSDSNVLGKPETLMPSGSPFSSGEVWLEKLAPHAPTSAYRLSFQLSVFRFLFRSSKASSTTAAKARS